MVTYRTSDNDRWGAGKGSALSAVEIDDNFWELQAEILALQNDRPEPNEIASFQVIGSQMTIFLEDGRSFGPFTLPTAMLHFVGDWAPNTGYNELDLVLVPNDALYMVLRSHTSANTFNPNATDSNQQRLYQVLMPVREGGGGGGGVGDFASLSDTPSEFGEANQILVVNQDRTGLIYTTLPEISQVQWGNIQNRPSTFPPSAHFHTFVSLTDTPNGFGTSGQFLAVNPNGDGFIYVDPSAYTGDGIADAPFDDKYYLRYNAAWVELAAAFTWGNIGNKPATFPPDVHSHAWDAITNKPTTFPPSSHGHNWPAIAQKPEFINQLPEALGDEGDVLQVVGTGLEWRPPTAVSAAQIEPETNNFTFATKHIGKYVRVNSNNAVNATLPTGLGANGDVIEIRNAGSGKLTLVENGTIIAPPFGGTLVMPTGATAALKRISSTQWDLIGQVEAAE